MANYRDLIQSINQEATNVAALDVRIRVSVFTDVQLNELVDTVRAVYTDRDQQRVVAQRVIRRVNAAHPLKVASFNRSTKAYAFIDKATIQAAKDAAKAIREAGLPASAPAPASAAPATASAAPASSPASAPALDTASAPALDMVRASALAEALETIEGLLKTIETLEMQSASAKVGTGKKAVLKKAA